MQLNWEGVVPIVAGAHLLLAAFGWTRVSRNPAADAAWRQRYGRIIKVVAPLVIAFGFFLLLNVRSSEPQWERHSLGEYAADFPTMPKSDTKTIQSPMGSVSTRSLICQWKDADFRLSYNDVPGASGINDQDQLIGVIDQMCQAAGAQNVMVSEIHLGRTIGKEVKYEVHGSDGSLSIAFRICLSGKRVYRAMTVCRIPNTNPQWTQRFLTSFGPSE